MGSGFSCRNDADHLFTVLESVCVNDQKYNHAKSISQGMPAFFPINYPVEFRQMKRIVKDLAGKLETQPMLVLVDLVLVFIPFVLHDKNVCTNM